MSNIVRSDALAKQALRYVRLCRRSVGRGDPQHRGVIKLGETKALATTSLRCAERQVGDRSGEAATLNNMAWVLFHQGDLERALDMFAEVGRTLHEIGAVAEEAALLFNLAFVLGQYLGRQGEAIEHLTRSVEILHRYHLPQDAAGQTLAQHEAFLAQLLAAQELSEDEDE
ncbi:MAG: tetratricopeptide repeat protein [Caldilineae bacterium]|nr:tetratricopeptide repeat protein [Caldilineae bacterium]